MESHKFKKKYGQNFLRDETILDRIINESDILEDSLVIEIGPGDGALTNRLITKAKQVLAYEIDLDLKETLERRFNNKNVDFIFEDFLTRNIKDDIEKYNYKNIYVIANIPYYITTPIIEKLIDSKIDIKKIILMVQKEVGDRFSAKPGSRDYSSITVYLNYYYEIKKLFTVPRNCFYPVPNVDSAIISFEKKDSHLIEDEDKFFRFVKDSFRFKRKNLKNNLSNYDLKKVEEILNKHGMDLTVRAESISLDIFEEIYKNL